MEKLIHWFTSRVRVTSLTLVFLVVAGVFGAFALKREIIPSVDFATVIITTPFPGASPDEVEDLVTVKIEKQLRTVSGLKDVRAISQAGFSQITVTVDIDQVDSTVVFDEIQRAVQRVNDLPAQLPDNPKVTQVKSGEIPVFTVSLIGPVITPPTPKGHNNSPDSFRVRHRAAETLQGALEDIPGVSTVSLSGYRPREFLIPRSQCHFRWRGSQHPRILPLATCRLGAFACHDPGNLDRGL